MKKLIDHKANLEKNVESEISNLFGKWEPRLTNLIETISTKFGEFMESISYIGEVVLSRKDIVSNNNLPVHTESSYDLDISFK